MATLVLSAVGGVLGGLVGGPIGAIIGRAIGGLAGAAVDNAVLGAMAPTQHVEGPRLKDLQVMASTEGAPIPRIYGTVRIAGQVIWATRLEEEVHTQTSGGGKGGGPKVTTTTYSYFANFAVGLCEGPVARINRIWADGKPLDLDGIVWRFHPGTETQAPDPLIAAKEGLENTPAYRGLAYVVFERLPLEDFGNRIPQLTFEVVRPVDGVADAVRAVDIIPGSGEFFCAPEPVRRLDAPGADVYENVHGDTARTDWQVSMDQLQAACRNLDAVAFVVSWFGDDLRCGRCTVRPKVEVASKYNLPPAYQWSVSGLTRGRAATVSLHDGRPAFGGTPTDAAVIAAIRDLKARGLAVTFYPFVMMDIPAGNALPDPWTGSAGQPPYPWRGRITCDPAPGRPGTPDGTDAAAAQVAAFVGTVRPEHFRIEGDRVIYSGPDEWSYRRFVLHNAWLCKAAGGVEAFLVGSELCGLTAIRDAAGGYPFVEALRQLAADVKSILGPGCKVSYAADWSEWSGHDMGGGRFVFHLDPFWADPNVDFIGIDNYLPLADWRDGLDHRDAEAGALCVYDVDYLKANVAGGEYYDWYYASPADRDAQIRTPITDGAYGRPWVWRRKDILNWWKSLHYDRPDGTEKATPTPWRPQGKPVWFTEAGCPAVDKGANQPNVFYDPKSSESALPHYSNGRRDDAMQLAYVRAMTEYWSAPGDHNPVSAAYGGPMVEPSRIFFWAWDARPWPWFPARGDVWGDVDLHETGHWLNGRLGAAAVEEIVRAVCADWQVDFPIEVEPTGAVVTGFVIDRPMTARGAIEQLGRVFGFDAVTSGDRIAFRRRHRRPVRTVTRDDLADADAGDGTRDGGAGPLYEIVRQDAAERPKALALAYFEAGNDHQPAVVRARADAGGAIVPSAQVAPVEQVQVAAAMPQSLAGSRAAVMLAEAAAADETLAFALGPDHLDLEPGDVITFVEGDGTARTWRLKRVNDEGPLRRCEAVRHVPEALEPPPWPSRRMRTGWRVPPVAPAVMVMDIPRLRDDLPAERPCAAAFARPWRGTVVMERQRAGLWGSATLLEVPAVMGELLDPLPAARPWIFDRAHAVRVRLFGTGQLLSVDALALFSGANAAAIGDPTTGLFEIVQFMQAELVAASTWRISMLLRGQRGSDPEIADHPAGSRFVLLAPEHVVPAAGFGVADIDATVTLRAGPAGTDPASDVWRTFAVPFAARGLRPLAPVHLKRRVLPGGDWRLEWIRRSRAMDAADAWGRTEPPLDEAFERYVVHIGDGTRMVREIVTDTPQALWSATDQAADFPAGMPADVVVRVAQVSETFGPGAPTERRFAT